MKMPSTKKAASKAFNGHNKGQTNLEIDGKTSGAPKAKRKKKPKKKAAY
tara:strand:+ start:1126 stop:1272 length:147 start_codon:yes stop_codon:yes gene_type:complete